jgi:hypothetical protein
LVFGIGGVFSYCGLFLGRNPTNRWTRAAGACFSTSLVRRRVR